MVKFVVRRYLLKKCNKAKKMIGVLTEESSRVEKDSEEEKALIHDIMIFTRHRDYLDYVIRNKLFKIV